MRILLVEDDVKLARFLTRALSEEGYVVEACAKGSEAVSRALAGAYELVVLDWMLPELDGLEACRRLRAAGARVPVLMLSARADVGQRVTALDAGADDYLTKPFHLEELLARVRAAVRRGDGASQRLVIGSLVLELLEHAVRVNERKVELTPREYALLVLLARSAGKTVSRRDILAHVWQTARDAGSNVIEVHVRNLREKLGDGAPPIETVRGLGYRLAARAPA